MSGMKNRVCARVGGCNVAFGETSGQGIDEYVDWQINKNRNSDTKALSTCQQMCGKIPKLLDDVQLELSDNEIYDYVDRQLEYFTEQLGGIEKVLEFYNKRDELSFRDELFETFNIFLGVPTSLLQKIEIFRAKKNWCIYIKP